MIRQLQIHRHILLGAVLYTLIFTPLGFLATHSVDQALLLGSGIWLSPVLGLFFLRSDTTVGYRLLCYIVALVPVGLVYSSILAGDGRDVSTQHLIILFAILVAALALVVVVLVGLFERLDWRLYSKFGDGGALQIAALAAGQRLSRFLQWFLHLRTTCAPAAWRR